MSPWNIVDGPSGDLVPSVGTGYGCQPALASSCQEQTPECQEPDAVALGNGSRGASH